MESLLKFQKPGRYTGGEYNTPASDYSSENSGILRMCLCFPDLYEIGISNLGLLMLYHIANSMQGVVAERSYTPHDDLEQYLTGAKEKLFSVESRRPLDQFDILGISIQNELQLTNALNIIALSGLPVLQKERDIDSPVIIAGGPGISNPVPYRAFFDAFVIGDGELALKEILETGKLLKSDAGSKKIDRELYLKAISTIRGVYVPSVHKSGSIMKSVAPLLNELYPVRQLVPTVVAVHDRLTYEVSRGCPRMCRFCHASFINMPYRVKKSEDIRSQIPAALAATGYNEVSLLSLSATDLFRTDCVFEDLARDLATRHISVALPSVRIDSFGAKHVEFSNKIRSTGFTLAPESGSEGLRRLLGKKITDPEIFSALGVIRKQNIRKTKLYFMYGFAFEKTEDIYATNSLIKSLKRSYPEMDFNITLSPFCPKPHTPLQYSAFAGGGSVEDIIARMKEKERMIMSGVKANIKTHSIYSAIIESLIAKGDDSVSRLVKSAFDSGARFDCWKDHFSFPIWQKAQENSGVDIAGLISSYSWPVDDMPWDFIDYLIPKKFLKREYKNILESQG